MLIAGARTPAEFLFRRQLGAWAVTPSLNVKLTIDRPPSAGTARSGSSPSRCARLALDAARTTAFLCGPETMMRLLRPNVLLGEASRPTSIQVSLERNMQCGVGLCGHCQLGPLLLCRDGPVVGCERGRAAAGRPGAVMTTPTSSPPEPRRLEVRVLRRLPAHPARLRGRAAGPGRPGGDRVISSRPSSAVLPGPYDLSLVEGSDHHRGRRASGSARSARSPGSLVTIGACATAGGIQALRNFGDVDEFRAAVYASPSTSTRWPPPRRSPTTCPSTSSCAAARSTSASCSS